MAQIIDDPQRKHYKPYRDHSKDVPIELKTVSKGFLITGQNDAGHYSVDCPGHEAGWAFWPPRVGKKKNEIEATMVTTPTQAG